MERCQHTKAMISTTDDSSGHVVINRHSSATNMTRYSYHIIISDIKLWVWWLLSVESGLVTHDNLFVVPRVRLLFPLSWGIVTSGVFITEIPKHPCRPIPSHSTPLKIPLRPTIAFLFTTFIHVCKTRRKVRVCLKMTSRCPSCDRTIMMD